MSRPPVNRPPLDYGASLARLRDGGIPLRAAQRLTDEAGPGRKLFTSDLSTSEFLAAREANVEPIAQVMGSSIYHIGRIDDYKGTTGEVSTISSAHRKAREAALGRLEEEARIVGADVVIGVRLGERLITRGAHGKGGDDGDEVIEFTVVGTAARAPWLTHSFGVPGPILTDLSGQDVWALARDGWAPSGIVFDFCRYHVFHVTDQSRGSTYGTGEFKKATSGVVAARQLVEGRILDQAKRAHGDFVVGADVKLTVREVPCGWGGCGLDDVDIDVSWFGTAIRRAHHLVNKVHPGPPALILSLLPLGRRRRRDLVEGIESESKELEREAREEEARAAEGEGGEKKE